jgi:hypothetical protein
MTMAKVIERLLKKDYGLIPKDCQPAILGGKWLDPSEYWELQTYQHFVLCSEGVKADSILLQ